MLRCTGTRTDRYEHWYSLLDQMCPHQYQASIPRRAYIRWVPDLTVSPGAIPRFVLPRYCCGSSLYSVRSGRSSFRRAKPPPKSDNAIFGSLPRGQGGCSGRVPFWPLGQRRSGRCQGTSRHPALLLQTLAYVWTDEVVAAGMLARLSSRLVYFPITPPTEAEKGLKLGQT